jgi:hypothetical protein
MWPESITLAGTDAQVSAARVIWETALSSATFITLRFRERLTGHLIGRSGSHMVDLRVKFDVYCDVDTNNHVITMIGFDSDALHEAILYLERTVPNALLRDAVVNLPIPRKLSAVLNSSSAAGGANTSLNASNISNASNASNVSAGSNASGGGGELRSWFKQVGERFMADVYVKGRSVKISAVTFKQAELAAEEIKNGMDEM